MKKAKILAGVLSCTMLLSAAFAMQSSAAEPESAPEYVDVVKNGDFSAGAEGWSNVMDDGTTAPTTPLQFQDGKVIIPEGLTDGSQNQHLKQTVKVESDTTYKFRLTCNLTAGGIRLDNVILNEAERGATWYDNGSNNTGIVYGTEQTFEIDVATGDRTELTLDLRVQLAGVIAVGEIYKIELIELDAEGNPVEVPTEEPGTDPEEPGTEEPGTDPEEPGTDPEEPGTEEPGTEPEMPEAVNAGVLFPNDNAGWATYLDEDGVITTKLSADDSGAVKIEDGKIVFSAETKDWIHFMLPVNVKANTTYTLKITANLTAGNLRLDNVVTGIKENPLTWYEDNGNGSGIAYGEHVFETTIETGDRTQLLLDIRNQSTSKAIGEISKIELVEEGTDGTTDENPDTGVAFPLAALCVAALSTGAVCVSKKNKK